MSAIQQWPVLLLLLWLVSLKLAAASLFDFGDMITCATGRSSFDYNPYGCHCGLGGEGEAVDNIDRCCEEHDLCYRTIRVGLGCRVKTDNYAWQCAIPADNTNFTAVMCDNQANERCERMICGCDLAAVQCFVRHDSDYPADKPGCPTPKAGLSKFVSTVTTFMDSLRKFKFG